MWHDSRSTGVVWDPDFEMFETFVIFPRNGRHNTITNDNDKKHCHRQNVTSYHSFSLLWLVFLLSLSSQNNFSQAITFCHKLTFSYMIVFSHGITFSHWITSTTAKKFLYKVYVRRAFKKWQKLGFRPNQGTNWDKFPTRLGGYPYHKSQPTQKWYIFMKN